MKVIGIGDNVVDKYEHRRVRYPGGNALNFSVYAAMLDASAAYLGIFGNDAAADHVMRALAKFGIDIRHCRQVAGENGYARLTIEQGNGCFRFESRRCASDGIDGLYFATDGLA